MEGSYWHRPSLRLGATCCCHYAGLWPVLSAGLRQRQQRMGMGSRARGREQQVRKEVWLVSEYCPLANKPELVPPMGRGVMVGVATGGAGGAEKNFPRAQSSS